MKKRSIPPILTTLALLLLLSGCGQSKEPEPENPSEPQDPAYLAAYHAVDLDCTGLRDVCAIDDSIYILDSRWKPDFGDTGTLSRVSPDGTLLELFPADSCLDGRYGTVHPLSLCAGADGALWLLLDCWPAPEKVDEIPRGTFLCQYDGEGTELARLDITDSFAQCRFDWIDQALLDEDGWLYLFCEGAVRALDGQQQLQFSLSCNSFNSPCGALLSDGRAAAVVLEAKGPGEPAVYELRTIDREAQDWGDAYPIGSNCYQVYSGSGKYLFFCNTGSEICGWNTESGQLDTLMDYNNSDVNFSSNVLTYFTVLEDGRMIAVTYTDGRGELAVLTPVDAGELPEKTVLTLACVYCPSQLQWHVTEFNKSSQEYRVEIKEYMTDRQYSEGLQRMIVDIIAGNVPDLLCLGNLSIQKFGAKGILEDLWPYIDGDPELSRENLMSHVLECAETDGRLYEIFDSFTIKTVGGAAGVVGDRLSWTMEDLQAALETMPEGCSAFGPYVPQDYLLYQLVCANMDRFVDWETGTCSFDSQEFKDMLAFAEGVGDAADGWYPEVAVMDKEQMLYTGSFNSGLTNLMDIQIFEFLFGGPVSFVGYPKQDGACGSSFYVSENETAISMTSACGDKEGAWAFLRRLLLPQGVKSEDVFRSFRFPINRQDFELLAKYSMAEPEMRHAQSFDEPNGNTLRLFYSPLTQEEYEQIMELYGAIDSMYTTDSDIMEVIYSEAGVYFAGDISLDQAAERIQSRVQLYVNEQR